MSAAIERIVVVGNGIAGLTSADSLRDNGFDGQLTIVGDEPHPAYSRPALSKALLRDGEDITSHCLPDTQHGARELLGVRASGLDVERRVVVLEDGSTLPYDRLVIATGSRARRLSDLPGETTLRGLDDALRLRKHLAGRPSVAVVGGGPLGMEIASACLEAGCRVTLVSRGEPLSALVGPHLAGMFTSAARERGLAIIETAHARLDNETRVVFDGGEVEGDLVVTAAGDVPNTEWLAGSGLCTRGALPVDARGLVRPDIAAVGDLAAFPTSAGRTRLPLWHSAIEQAKVAAAALLRGDEAPELTFESYFWTEQFGLSVKVLGRLPVAGTPVYVDGEPGVPALMRWAESGVCAAVNYRISIPKLRRVRAETA
jgi:NADPH-dependent 2,4-dienoyl-CoA reductase/sulfur reductase-like enzyme